MATLEELTTSVTAASEALGAAAVAAVEARLAYDAANVANQDAARALVEAEAAQKAILVQFEELT